MLLRLLGCGIGLGLDGRVWVCSVDGWCIWSFFFFGIYFGFVDSFRRGRRVFLLVLFGV